MKLTHARLLVQRGFTLIEVLVTLALGMLVIAFVGGIFTSARVNQDTQDDIAMLQENIRITGAMVRRVVFHAGHQALPQSSALALGTTQFGLSGTDGTGTAIGSQDTLITTYEGDGMPDAPTGAITDCLGRPVGIGSAAQVAAAVSSGAFARTSNQLEIKVADGRPWLGCSVNGAAWVPLIPDVEGMEIEYGIDQTGDAVADTYGVAGTVPFTQAIAVRVSILFRTNREIATSPDGATYMLAEQTYGPFNDKRVRRMISFTVGVRNAKA
jgi:type IV pilus assembly protein PilW